MQPAKNTDKILPITSVRFFAALYVVLFHLRDACNSIVGWRSFAGRVIALGFVSVGFFFFLSGFVLAITYLNGRPGPIPLRRFFISRFARLYPALAACLLLDLPRFYSVERHVLQLGSWHFAGAILISFTALEAWFPSFAGMDLATWSLSAEVFFYLLFPWVGPWLWRQTPRMLWSLATTLFIVSNVISRVLSHQTWISGFTQDYHPLTHIATFLLGICLAKVHLFVASSPRWQPVVKRTAPLVLLLSALLFLAIPAFQLRVPWQLMQHSFLVPLYAMALLALASGNRFLDNVFSMKWLVILGEASFALYLVHLPLIEILRPITSSDPRIQIPLWIAAAIGVSVLSFFLLETPARRFILRRAQLRSPETTAASSIAQ